MNDHKIDSQARNEAHQQQSHVLITDFSFEFDACSSSQQNMGTWVQQQQDIDHQQSRQSSTIMSRFESPTLAFYATERFMGFPQYESQLGNFNTNNNNPSLSSQFSSCSSQNPIICDLLDQQTEPNFEFRNSIQQTNNISPFLGHVSSTTNSTPSITRQFSLDSKQNQEFGGYSGSLGSPFSQLSFGSSYQYNNNQEKQSSRLASRNEVSSISTINNAVSNINGHTISSKTRIRWTQDLHEKFVECVNRLGGSEKATPKAILRLMESDGLTIFHVKSHLQKYRIAKYLPDSSEGKYDKRASIDTMPSLETTTGLQIKEALQLQLDVQRRLHEQLEIQRTLQLQIEEQGKQLKMMFDMQQRTSNSLSSDISSLDEAPSDNVDEVLLAETSGNNTHFPSKIS